MVFSAGVEFAPLVVHRHPDQLADGRWLCLRWRTQAQVREDARDGQLVGDVGHDLERTSAASAHVSIGALPTERSDVEALWEVMQREAAA